jgi:polysaccharide export outer membrane protein
MLNDVISAAGGVTPTASSKVIITHKNGATVPVRVQYNPTALTPVIPRIQVFPGDTITVPRAGIVYVLGNVIRPGGFVLEGRSDMTVERALALAGGTGHAAAVSRTQLVRTLDGGQKEQIVLSLNHILNSKAPDMAMKDGDILYVPTSNAMLVTQQAITSAVGVGGTILVYRLGIQ